MIITTIDTATLLNREPTLDQYLPETQLDFETQIIEAKREILQKLKDHNKFIRKYCTPAVLQASVSKTSSFTSDAVEDNIERMIWSVKVTAAGATENLILQGCNTSDGTFVDIAFLTFTEPGTKYQLFEDTFKFYKIVYAGTSITFESSLIESSFYLAHLFLSLALCYQLNIAQDNDLWEKKFTYYTDRFDTQMERMIASYDSDESGDLESGEIGHAVETEIVR